MSEIPGMKKPELQELPQIVDRLTFLYLEHCKISRQDSAITVRDNEGIVYIPSGAISVLLLGPGTDISHRAMEAVGDSGVSIIWVGEQGVRYYASGRPLTHSSRMLIRQAEYVSNQRKHLAVVRKMYEMRFPGEDISNLTLQQLRGREGSRIRQIYKRYAAQYKVPWTGREYDPDNFELSSLVNQALSVGHACLYGLAHAVIVALGCSAGLGFVHVGHENSFVYDIADLYKAEISIPVAFAVAAEEPENVESVVRHRVRDTMSRNHLLERMVHDIKYLFSEEDNKESMSDESVKSLALWDMKNGEVPNATLYLDQKDGK